MHQYFRPSRIVSGPFTVPWLVLLVLTAAWAPILGEEGPEQWEESVAAFERADRDMPPAKGAILFIGSSSIRLWNLPQHFPDLNVVNRGFGGSQIRDVVHFANRIVIPYQPRLIVLYAGDNDIAAGKKAEQLLSDFQEFVRVVRDKLPDTRIVFISIKPSPARWHLVAEMRRANQLIHDSMAQDDRLEYSDVHTAMIGANGQPRAELFISDGLHLNEDGYKLWTTLLRGKLSDP
jgi:lysophospholipase L1-like esterase